MPVNNVAPVDFSMFSYSFRPLSCGSVKVCTLVAELQKSYRKAGRPTTKQNIAVSQFYAIFKYSQMSVFVLKPLTSKCTVLTSFKSLELFPGSFV